MEMQRRKEREEEAIRAERVRREKEKEEEEQRKREEVTSRRREDAQRLNTEVSVPIQDKFNSFETKVCCRVSSNSRRDHIFKLFEESLKSEHVRASKLSRQVSSY